MQPDAWCAKEGRDPGAIVRTANVGFYMGADVAGAARQEALCAAQWGAEARQRGFLRGTPAEAVETVARYRDIGVERFIIGVRQGPYDWEALHAFAERVVPAFGSEPHR